MQRSSKLFRDSVIYDYVIVLNHETCNHNKAADELYETMYEKFSKEERFKKSADFMENLKRETEMQRLIEEEILNEIVYVK